MDGNRNHDWLTDYQNTSLSPLIGIWNEIKHVSRCRPMDDCLQFGKLVQVGYSEMSILSSYIQYRDTI